jgi:hypothetical protein
MTSASFETAGLTATTGRMISDLEKAAATGSAALVSVSLDALEQFYAQLWTMHDQVEAAITRNVAVRETPRAHVTSDHVIAGVHHALVAGRNSVSSGHEGLERSLVRLRRLLEKNLDALYQAYSGYVAADADGATQLDTASGGLTTVNPVAM